MEYNLTFADVLNEIFENKKIKCWYQGEDSMDCFIPYDEFGKDVFLNKEDIRR